MKTIDEYFADWEGHVFGFGYGTGEPHVLNALKHFVAKVPDEGGYDYSLLEEACGAAVAWLLINALAHADIIEYGTSPRFGWLTPQGKALAAYVRSTATSDLVLATCRDENYIHCYPDHCNCDNVDCRDKNPFWPKRTAHSAPPAQ